MDVSLSKEEIEQEIRLISDRLAVIDKDTPNMTGMDFANDQGWISQDEWEAADAKSKLQMKMQNDEVEKIDGLRREHPQAMEDFLADHLIWLEAIYLLLEQLAQIAQAKELEFAMRFNLTILPDIISCLAAWRSHAEPKHWPAWMWRLAFRVGEECELFVATQTMGRGG